MDSWISFAYWLIAESPAEFFAENKNIAGFDNVIFFTEVYIFRYINIYCVPC